MKIDELLSCDIKMHNNKNGTSEISTRCYGTAAVAMSLAFGMHSVSSGIWLAKKDFVVVWHRRHGKTYFVVLCDMSECIDNFLSIQM